MHYIHRGVVQVKSELNRRCEPTLPDKVIYLVKDKVASVERRVLWPTGHDWTILPHGCSGRQVLSFMTSI
jgi:hypothetical protein